jgi:hypothetical protein
MEINLKGDLPKDAFSVYSNKKGKKFYQVQFDLVLAFESVLVLKFMHGNQIIKHTKADYVPPTENPTTLYSNGGQQIAGESQAPLLGARRGW